MSPHSPRYKSRAGVPQQKIVAISAPREFRSLLSANLSCTANNIKLMDAADFSKLMQGADNGFANMVNSYCKACETGALCKSGSSEWDSLFQAILKKTGLDTDRLKKAIRHHEHLKIRNFCVQANTLLDKIISQSKVKREALVKMLEELSNAEEKHVKRVEMPPVAFFIHAQYGGKGGMPNEIAVSYRGFQSNRLTPEFICETAEHNSYSLDLEVRKYNPKESAVELPKSVPSLLLIGGNPIYLAQTCGPVAKIMLETMKLDY